VRGSKRYHLTGEYFPEERGKMSRRSRKAEMEERGMLEEVTPTQALEGLHFCGEEMDLRPVVLVGPVGMGKTTVALDYCRERAKRAGYDDVIDARVTKPQRGEASYSFLNFNNMEPEDLVYPSYGNNKKYTQYIRQAVEDLPGADPSWGRPEDIHNTMLLEEIGKKREMMPSVAQFMEERSLGTSYLVPPQVHIIGTANGAGDNASSFNFTADLMDRCTIYKVRTTAKSWLQYHEGELHPIIVCAVGCLEEAFLNTFEAEPRGQQFSTPRSMKTMSDFLTKGLDLSTQVGRATMYGTIGHQAGRELLAVHDTMNNMVDLDAMIADPVGMADQIEEYRLDNSNNGRIRLAGMIAILSKRVRKDATQVNKLFPFVKLFGEELEVTFAHMALSVNKDVQKQEEYVNHMVRLQDTHYF
tara:strand:- start:2241 stop:3482 length:1242 start_codon:yes stop_codon:yes gene_type:complete